MKNLILLFCLSIIIGLNSMDVIEIDNDNNIVQLKKKLDIAVNKKNVDMTIKHAAKLISYCKNKNYKGLKINFTDSIFFNNFISKYREELIKYQKSNEKIPENKKERLIDLYLNNHFLLNRSTYFEVQVDKYRKQLEASLSNDNPQEFADIFSSLLLYSKKYGIGMGRLRIEDLAFLDNVKLLVKNKLIIKIGNSEKEFIDNLIDQILIPLSKNIINNTKLILAVKNGNKDQVEKLLQLNVNIDEQNKTGNTALHYASHLANDDAYNSISILEILLNKATDKEINCINLRGRTPLHIAALHGNFTAFKMLLSKNADILHDNNGKTPLELAQENGHKSIIII